MRKVFSIASLCFALVLGVVLTACVGGTTATRPEQPTANLNRADAVRLINEVRAKGGLAPVVEDAALSARAVELASYYARTGRQAPRPQEVYEVRYAATYTTYSEALRALGSTAPPPAAMGGDKVQRVGIGAVYEALSPYGFYWALVAS